MPRLLPLCTASVWTHPPTKAEGPEREQGVILKARMGSRHCWAVAAHLTCGGRAAPTQAEGPHCVW